MRSGCGKVRLGGNKRELQGCLSALFLGLHASGKQSSRWKLLRSRWQLNGYGRQRCVQVLLMGLGDVFQYMESEVGVAKSKQGSVLGYVSGPNEITSFCKSSRGR